jgi:arginyl-tRNA synthetase
MLALQGNTAPYLLYAYTRLAGILRKAGTDQPDAASSALIPPSLGSTDELILSKHLLKFGQVLELVTEDYRPNFLCSYLHELSGHLARFYESCPVLQAVGHEKVSRLILCSVSARVLKEGLGLLGIETTESM